MRLEKERLYYLDELKGFAILLVVLGHILYIGNPIRVWIYSFHMPLFFMISGFLSNRNFLSVKETFNKKFKSLIVPYIMFGCAIIAFNILLNKGITGEIKTYILYFVTGVGRDALWFLLALFIIEISHSILKNYIKNKYIIFVIISCLFIIGLYGNRIYSNLILITIYRSLIGLTFFMVGNYSSSYIRKVNIKLIWIFIALIITLILSLVNGQIDLWGLAFNNKVLYVICSVVTSISLILLFKEAFNNNIRTGILRYFGINSLIIMSTHQLIIDIINNITNASYYKITIGVGIFLIVMILEIPIIYIINNYTPLMLGKFKKKEKLKLTVNYK